VLDWGGIVLLFLWVGDWMSWGAVVQGDGFHFLCSMALLLLLLLSFLHLLIILMCSCIEIIDVFPGRHPDLEGEKY
jgi:hypothetical protein